MKRSLLFLAITLSAASTQATVIADFGSANYITSNSTPASQWTNTGGAPAGTIAYNSAFSAIYTANLGTDAIPAFGAGAYSGNAIGSNNNFVNNADGGLDALQLDGGTPSGTPVNNVYAAVVMFDKANFLNGGDSSVVDLGTGSSFSARGTTQQSNDTNFEARWVIQQTDNSYAISSLAGLFGE